MHKLTQNVTTVLLMFVLVTCGSHLTRPEAFERNNIPLPEHPRPDFQRQHWLNLNGPWQFRFDSKNEGQDKKWFTANVDFSETIMVPFPWGSKLSGVKDEADIAWYARSIDVPESWQGQRVFLIIGACDWHTTGWLDGNLLGNYQGGYTPFEFDLTPYLQRNPYLLLRCFGNPGLKMLSNPLTKKPE